MTPKRTQRYPRDLTGIKFGMLVLRRVSGGKNSRWECLCHCGRKTVIARPDVFIAQSCGCTRYDNIITHGMSYSPTHKSWGMMRDRCLNRDGDNYKEYGGRGIKVCARWNNFENFLEDMGLRPSLKYSLERLDNNGNYEKSNCKWATRHEQNRNTRRNVWITAFGKTMCLQDWSIEHDIRPNTLRGRIRKGMPPEEALTNPMRNSRVQTK